MKKTLVPIAIALIAALSLSACNTTAGVGRDIKSTGKAIERSAEDARP
ncbi:MAG: entericidin A/B family lipoprotein [Rhodospirillaceae bacterium]